MITDELRGITDKLRGIVRECEGVLRDAESSEGMIMCSFYRGDFEDSTVSALCFFTRSSNVLQLAEDFRRAITDRYPDEPADKIFTKLLRGEMRAHDSPEFEEFGFSDLPFCGNIAGMAIFPRFDEWLGGDEWVASKFDINEP